MNRLNSKGHHRRFDGHFVSLYNEYAWIAIAIRCIQFWRPSAFPCMAIVPEAKEYWNGNRGQNDDGRTNIE